MKQKGETRTQRLTITKKIKLNLISRFFGEEFQKYFSILNQIKVFLSKMFFKNKTKFRTKSYLELGL